MAEWLLIRLPRVPDRPASWLIVDGRGAAVGPEQSGPLSLAAMRTAGRRICVLVPATDVLVTEPEIPAKAGTKLQQVVPFALEEQLAEDLDDLHFAIGKRAGESSRVPVAVVTRSLMDEWLTMLRSSGIEPDALYADSDLLPENPGQSVLLLEEDVVIVRPVSGSPVTLPSDALAEALELAGAAPADADTGTATARGLILYTGAAEWQQHSAQVEASRPHFDGVKIQLLSNGPLVLFGQQLPAAHPINLLQGSYPAATSNPVGWRAWRIAAILLVALIGLHVAGKAAELSLLKRSEHKLDASIRETFHTAMPGEQNAVDAHRRMEQRLAAVRSGGSGLLAALETLTQAHGTVPGAVIQSLSFHNGTLDLKISAPDAASLDRISQALRNSGWQADLTAGNVVGSAYEGRIQIRSNGT